MEGKELKKKHSCPDCTFSMLQRIPLFVVPLVLASQSEESQKNKTT